MVVIVSIPLLLLAAFACALPGGGPSVPSTLSTLGAWGNIGVLFAIALAILFVGNKLLGRPLRGLLVSFVAVFAVALLAQWVAKIDTIKYYGFEAVFFSVIFGLIIRNCFRIPEWLKPAIQGEFFIKIGVVCLGATILFRDVMKSGSVGLVQALIVVCIVWFFAYFIARRLKVDRATAMTLSSGVSICGVSACITAARVAGTDDRKLSYIVSVVLIIVVPMIYLMPWLAETIIPLITSDPVVQQEIAGAWIGGTIDTTSGVAASSEMAFSAHGDLANKTAVIVKATQNVLIGVVAFFIALYLSTKGEGGESRRPSLGIVWGEVSEVHSGLRGGIARIQPLPVERHLPRCRRVEAGRDVAGEDILYVLLLACLRMYRSRHAVEGYRIEGEPQRPLRFPRRAVLQYRGHVRRGMAAFRCRQAGLVVG